MEISCRGDPVGGLGDRGHCLRMSIRESVSDMPSCFSVLALFGESGVKREGECSLWA